MSFPKEPDPALFFIAVTEREKGFFLELKHIFEEDLGMLLLQSSTYNFSEFTDYYEKEMGKPLWKTFYFFEYLKDPSFLVDFKHLCFKIEREYATLEGNRRINIDPGYLTLSKVVLSTFKDYVHRIYLGNSVYGEVTLIFREGTFQPLAWTYPDYKKEEVIQTFNLARKLYKEKLHACR
ncbi:MAG: DUF4416 family protein [Caldimicrobium sp.]